MRTHRKPRADDGAQVRKSAPLTLFGPPHKLDAARVCSSCAGPGGACAAPPEQHSPPLPSRRAPDQPIILMLTRNPNPPRGDAPLTPTPFPPARGGPQYTDCMPRTASSVTCERDTAQGGRVIRGCVTGIFSRCQPAAARLPLVRRRLL